MDLSMKINPPYLEIGIISFRYVRDISKCI